MSSESLSDSEIKQAAALLSSERLSALIAIAGTERDAYDLHAQMLRVAAALMPVTALLEISLRNAICDNLRSMFDTPDWLTSPPAPFRWRGEEEDSLKRARRQAQRAAYSKKSSSDKKALDTLAYPMGVPAGLSHETRAKSRQKAIVITLGQLIAQLTLMFWKRLFSSDYEAALWARSLKRLFPNKALSRAEVAIQLEAIYQARNRIAHHEPLYGARLARALEAIDFVAESYAVSKRSPDAILARMIGPSRLGLQAEVDTLDAMLARFNVPA